MSRLGALAFALAFASVSLPCVAHADTPEPDPKSVEDARFYFVEGSTHFQAKRYDAALASLERSYALAPSPNTGLLIARSLRELGRNVEAVGVFERTERDAKRRVAQGESKYAPTQEAAASEGAATRARVGSIRIHIARAAGSTLTVDGRSVPISAEGDATLLHDPGTATVVVKDSSGAQQRQTMTVLAGSTMQMDFAGDAIVTPPPPPPPPPPPKRDHGSAWALPAAIGTGVLALAGGGVFVGFGLASKATYDDLFRRCGPTHCGPADQPEADRGKREQTIANIGLGVGAVGLAFAATFTVIYLTSGSSSASASPLFYGRFDARGAGL